MSRGVLRRWSRSAIAVVVLVGALVFTASAAATVETFHRFEVDAVANYTVTEQCADSTTRQLLVQVIAGHEEEAENGETTLDEDFLTVRVQGQTCDQPFVFFRAFGTGEFTFSPSLQTASITGTATGRGHVVTVDLSWEGPGEIEVTNNTTTRPGFVGHFQGKERAAVATGTVVIDGDTVVDGSTTNARIETLEDNNIRTSGG